MKGGNSSIASISGSQKQNPRNNSQNNQSRGRYQNSQDEDMLE